MTGLLHHFAVKLIEISEWYKICSEIWFIASCMSYILFLVNIKSLWIYEVGKAICCCVYIFTTPGKRITRICCLFTVKWLTVVSFGDWSTNYVCIYKSELLFVFVSAWLIFYYYLTVNSQFNLQQSVLSRVISADCTCYWSPLHGLLVYNWYDVFERSICMLVECLISKILHPKYFIINTTCLSHSTNIFLRDWRWMIFHEPYMIFHF